MNTINTLISNSTSRYTTAFENGLTPQSLQEHTPAAFAPTADESLSPAYRFISTRRVLDALGQAGFIPVAARQTRTRAHSALHACHCIRLRRKFETVALADGVPELIFLNSHDGSSTYQLHMAVFRPICTNGLCVAATQFPVWRISHRRDVLDEIIKAALEMTESFALLGERIQCMERTLLDEAQRLEFADGALKLRFPQPPHRGIAASQLLEVRRPEDVGTDLWHTFNAVQENCIRGGLAGRSTTGRKTRSRGITAIREDVRLNAGLWDLAEHYLH